MRTDTSPGTLSNAPTGQVYTLYRPSSGTALDLISSVGQILDHTFLAPEGQTVYATVVASQPITRIGLRFHFVHGTGSGGNSVAMAISRDDLYIADMAVHFYVFASGWNLQTRDSAGPFVSVCSGAFSPALRTDGTEYAAEVRLIDDAAVVSVAGHTETCLDPNVASDIGPYIFWENAYLGNSTLTVSAISALWAGFSSPSDTSRHLPLSVSH